MKIQTVITVNSPMKVAWAFFFNPRLPPAAETVLALLAARALAPAGPPAAPGAPVAPTVAAADGGFDVFILSIIE